jgi:hypothetical protein
VDKKEQTCCSASRGRWRKQSSIVEFARALSYRPFPDAARETIH